MWTFYYLLFSFFQSLCIWFFWVSSTFRVFFFVGISFFSLFVLPTVDALHLFFSPFFPRLFCANLFFLSNFEFDRDLGHGGRWVDWITHTHTHTHTGIIPRNHLIPTRSYSTDFYIFNQFSVFSPMFRSYSAEYYFWVWMWTVAHWPPLPLLFFSFFSHEKKLWLPLLPFWCVAITQNFCPRKEFDFLITTKHSTD